MTCLIRRLRAAFFVLAATAAGMGLAACSTSNEPSETYTQQALYKVMQPQCAAHRAVLAQAFPAALDAFIEADGAALEAAAGPVGRLVAMRAAGDDDAAKARFIYGEIAFAFAPYLADFLDARADTYTQSEASLLLTHVAGRLMENGAAVAWMAAQMEAAPCSTS